MDITGHTAIITGAGSGMGAATALALAEAGAKVALLDLNEKGMEKTAGEIDGLIIKCDVTSEKSVKAALEKAEKALGAPRVLVNCAGILLPKRILGKEGAADLAHFQKTLEVNLTGTFNTLRLASARMAQLEPITKDGGRGVIINTASIAAYEGQIGQAAYSASKGGIVAMTLPAARELAKFGIRVMAIAPGMVATPMIAGLSEEVQQSLEAQVPFPSRFARPEEFASLVRHIVENDMLNGETIRIDGAVRLMPK